MDKSADPIATATPPANLELPEWLNPAPTPDHQALVAQAKQDKRQLELIQFECSFDRVLERISGGNPLTAALSDEPYEINYSKYLSWIMKDETRKQQYYEAQTVGAEVVAQQMIAIADADDSIEDVARSTLRINTRKWLLGVWDRKRFGEVKQIDQTVTIDLGEAMRAAQERLDNRRTIDVTPRIVNG